MPEDIKKTEEKKELSPKEIEELKDKICGDDPSPFITEFVYGMPDEIFLERINNK